MAALNSSFDGLKAFAWQSTIKRRRIAWRTSRLQEDLHIHHEIPYHVLFKPRQRTSDQLIPSCFLSPLCLTTCLSPSYPAVPPSHLAGGLTMPLRNLSRLPDLQLILFHVSRSKLWFVDLRPTGCKVEEQYPKIHPVAKLYQDDPTQATKSPGPRPLTWIPYPSSHAQGSDIDLPSALDTWGIHLVSWVGNL